MTDAIVSVEDMRRVFAQVRRLESLVGNLTPQKPTNARPMSTRVEGFLLDDLAASADSGATETTARMTVWRGEGATWKEAEVVTVTNRSDGLSLAADAFITAVEINGELRPVGGGCESQNAVLQITVIGKPTGGTFTIALAINATTETITFNWNDSAANAKTAIAGHSLIASTDLDVIAGPFPNATINVEFIDTLANTDIAIPTANWGSLTGGSGVAVICSLAQRGHG